tara:strand:+ start:1474 stop:2334 length:861 start_codon:yes stop_codon:yes gene_type:complete
MSQIAELSIHKFMTDAVNKKSTMSKKIINEIGKDIVNALHKQFDNKKSKNTFKLRMSNIGRPYCQLWFEKNKPELAEPKSTNFIMNMMLGDIVEAVFKGLLKAAKVKFKDSEKVELNLKDTTIDGTYDLIIEDSVDDIKSASDWSYRNKFESYETLSQGDAFGYIAQLAGYAKATDKKAGGWWVVNKANGKFKYISANGINIDNEIKQIESTVKKLETNKFERCFEPEEETFRGKATGNLVLNKNCTFCDFKKACWENLIEAPAVMSKAQFPKIVSYVKLNKEKNI